MPRWPLWQRRVRSEDAVVRSQFERYASGGQATKGECDAAGGGRLLGFQCMWINSKDGETMGSRDE
jgi:hypothetical protein